MNRPRSALPVLSLVVLALVVASGCDFAADGERPAGVRFFTGSVTFPDEDILGRIVTGVQIAAVAIGSEAEPTRVDVFPSPVFDGSRRANARFTAQVPQDRSVVLILQVPGGTAGGPGSLVATLRFSDGRGIASLVPPGTGDVALGALGVEPGARAADAVLVVGDAANPLGQLDTDADGIADLSDDDDDADGTSDGADLDVAGDGVDDAKQVLPALPDGDGDGTPDLFEG